MLRMLTIGIRPFLIGLVVATVLFILSSTVASASCLKKNHLINEMVERLVDFSASADTAQQERDQTIIRRDAQSIGDEDCIGATPEMTRMVDFATNLDVELVALSDYGDTAPNTMVVMPIRRKIDHSSDLSDSTDCRCYARQQAIFDIFREVYGLLDTYSDDQHVAISERERRAIFAWYRVLDGYLYDAAGLHFASLNKIVSADVAKQRKAAFSQLQKHCGLTDSDAPFPGDCKFVR